MGVHVVAAGITLSKVTAVRFVQTSANSSAWLFRDAGQCGQVEEEVITLVAAMVEGLFTLPGFITAAAQDAATGSPKHPVHIDVPSPAGGATDIVARVVAQKIAEEWGSLDDRRK